MRKVLTAAAAVAVLIVGALTVPNLVSAQPGTVYGCVSSNHTLTHVSVTAPMSCPSQRPVSWPGDVGSPPSPSPSPTVSPTTSASPTPSPSTSPTGTACVKTNDVCGPFDASNIPMSNGFNTYVEAQQVGPNSGTSDTVTVNGPGDWNAVAHDVPYGYGGVQMFDNIQQLTNNWCGNGWDAHGHTCSGPDGDTPLNSLSALSVTYSETSPQDANSSYEFAPDVWSDNYGADVMFWADTHGRCNTGSYGDTVLGTAVLDGQTWTVNRYGAAGGEIIFVLDSNPSVPDSCAQQSSGTIDIKAGFDWLTSHGIVTGPEVITQLNTGWEVTSADNTTFTVNSYSITATPA